MRRTLRITGLVRLAEGVRAELAGALTNEARDRVRRRVERSMAEVTQIARDAGLSLGSLPGPSRRALDFLRGIDWDKLPVDPSAAPAAEPVTRFRWPGQGSLLQWLMDRLCLAPSDDTVEEIRQDIERLSRKMEATIASRQLSPDRLMPEALEQRGWLAYFSREDGVKAYVSALKLAGRIFAVPFSAQRKFPSPLRIHFRPLRGIYKLSAKRNGSVLTLPPAMVGFGEREFAILSRRIFSRDAEAKRELTELMTGEEYQSLQMEFEVLSGTVETGKGLYHDLGQSFERVNAGYFASSISRPKLVWSRSFTGRKFGHYDWINDTVMISSTLDRGDVPEYLVDFLMYHELLHKKHGIRWTNGRRLAHTADFYAEERLFAHFSAAERELDRIARG